MASFEESSLFILHNLNLKEDEVECKTEIGSGGCARVFVQTLCIGNNAQEKKPYAIKRIFKEDHRFSRKLYEREIKIFSRLAAQEPRVSEPISYFPSIMKNLFSFSTANTLCSFVGCTLTTIMCIY